MAAFAADLPGASGMRACRCVIGVHCAGAGRGNRRRLLMLRITLSAIAVSLLALTFDITAAHAQRVFVAAQGADANPCSFALPCRTFQHAHDVVAAGGEIDVLDPAGYGVVIITKSISIQGHDFSGISVTGGGTAVTISAGVSDVVNLRGLIIDGAASGGTGIRFNTGGVLTVDSTVIRRMTGNGIELRPNAATTFSFSATVVAGNGSNGISLLPSGSSAVRAVFNRVESLNNAQDGISVDGTFSTGVIRATAADSVAAGNLVVGFSVNSPLSGAATVLTLFDCLSANNDT